MQQSKIKLLPTQSNHCRHAWREAAHYVHGERQVGNARCQKCGLWRDTRVRDYRDPGHTEEELKDAERELDEILGQVRTRDGRVMVPIDW